MQKKIAYFLLAYSLFACGCIEFCLAEDSQKLVASVVEQDEIFKKSLAKVIFFLSILGSIAYFLKRHNGKKIVNARLAGAIKLLDETNIRGTKFALLEILDRKVLVATNQSGALEMIDINATYETSQGKFEIQNIKQRVNEN